MHAIRVSVQENRLSDESAITERSYLPFVSAGAAWVAEDHGGMIGFAAIDVDERRVWALFVRPDCERMGVGGALHRHMLEWAEARGLERLWLSTSPGTRAEGLYRRSGWTETGRTGDGECRFERRLNVRS